MSALSPFRVIEIAETVAGEYCGKLISDFGAEVIKVEPPTGSPTRALGPFGPGDGPAHERSGLFAYLNTGKRSVTLDLDTQEGRATLDRLLQTADALIDDHASGCLAAAGLEPAELSIRHPRLTTCFITPFGQDAPPERAHAEDLTVFQASGWGYHTPSGSDAADPPLKGAGRFMASYEAAMDAALCIAASLYGREASGRGRTIDISKQATMASRVDYVLGPMVAGEMDVSDARTAFDLWGPSTISACRDGFAYVWMSAPDHWEALRKLMGDPDWMKPYPPNWLEREATPERVAETRHRVAEWLATQDKEAVAAAAQAAGLMVVPVNNAADLPRSPQYQHREFFKAVDHPVLGRAAYPTVPYRLSATPAEPRSPAPLLGEANGRLASMSAPEAA